MKITDTIRETDTHTLTNTHTHTHTHIGTHRQSTSADGSIGPKQNARLHNSMQMAFRWPLERNLLGFALFVFFYRVSSFVRFGSNLSCALLDFDGSSPRANDAGQRRVAIGRTRRQPKVYANFGTTRVCVCVCRCVSACVCVCVSMFATFETTLDACACVCVCVCE